MSSILGSIFGFGDSLKRRLRDAASNPVDYAEMTADHNQNEWNRDPTERSLGFFNPVPMGNVTPFMLRKQLKEAVDGLKSESRRDFLKKSAGIAGGTAAASIPGAKLLQKFAPEERAIAKEAVTEAAPKYKYNSLKEYLDDVRYGADDASAEIYNGTMIQHNNLGDPFVVEGNHEVAMKAAKDFENSIIRDRLLRDEEAYNTAKFFYKDNLKDPTTGKWIDPFTGKPHSEEFLRNIRNNIEDFSPQAKKEMKAWKEMRPYGWHSPNEFERDALGRGLIPNPNGSLFYNPTNEGWHHYIPGKDGMISDLYKTNPEASDALKKLLQETWSTKTKTGF